MITERKSKAQVILDESFIDGEVWLPAGAKENCPGEAQVGLTPTTLRLVLPQTKVARLEEMETMATRCSGICTIRRRIDSAPSTVLGLVLLSAFLDSHFTESNRMMEGVERPTSYANSVCLTLGKMMRLHERIMYFSRKELLFLVHSFMWVDG